MFDMSGYGDYPDTDLIDCSDCGEVMAFHGDDMNLPIGDEYWECPGCGFKFMLSDLASMSGIMTKWNVRIVVEN